LHCVVISATKNHVVKHALAWNAHSLFPTRSERDVRGLAEVT